MSVPATGVSGADGGYATAMVQSDLPDFPGAAGLKATWHHKSFNPSTGRFAMQLVTRTSHRAYHRTVESDGAFADYLDWLADKVNNKDLHSLPIEQQLAITRTLRQRSSRMKSRINGRLDDAIDYAVTSITKSGYDIEITKNGARFTFLKAATNKKGSLLGVVVKSVGPVAIGMSVVVVGREMLAGDMKSAGEIIARDMLEADIVEALHSASAVSVANMIDDTLMISHDRAIYFRNGHAWNDGGHLQD